MSRRDSHRNFNLSVSSVTLPFEGSFRLLSSFFQLSHLQTESKPAEQQQQRASCESEREQTAGGSSCAGGECGGRGERG